MTANSHESLLPAEELTVTAGVYLMFVWYSGYDKQHSELLHLLPLHHPSLRFKSYQVLSNSYSYRRNLPTELSFDKHVSTPDGR